MSSDSSDRLAPPLLPWPPLLAVVYVIIIFFSAQFLASLVVYLYPLSRHWSMLQASNWLSNSVAGQFSFVLIAESLTVAAVYGWLWKFKSNFGAIGLKRPRLRDLAYGLLAAPLYYLLYALLLSIATKYFSINVNQQQNIGFDNVHGSWPLILTFISLVILAPIAEEILMRGMMYTSLKKLLRPLWAAILTSLIFAAAHLPEGGSGGPLWVAAIDTFTLSLVLCYLRDKTGSLWSAITLHSLKNTVAFAALFLLKLH